MLSQHVYSHFSFITKGNLHFNSNHSLNAYYMLIIGVMKMKDLVPIYSGFETSDGGFKQNFNIKYKIEVWEIRKGHVSLLKDTRKSKKGCCLSHLLNGMS